MTHLYRLIFSSSIIKNNTQLIWVLGIRGVHLKKERNAGVDR